jgi:hypothetical protein
MKKTYISPATNVIRIEKTLLQATSSMSKDTTNTISDNSQVLGRGGWFDDGEE